MFVSVAFILTFIVGVYVGGTIAAWTCVRLLRGDLEANNGIYVLDSRVIVRGFTYLIPFSTKFPQNTS
jgi:hypothetical protein